jgi:hypothetical protein
MQDHLAQQSLQFGEGVLDRIVVAARTIEDLWNAIGGALQQFTTQECANYFTAAGYELE